MEKQKDKNIIYTLSQNWIYFLYVYFTLVIISCLIITILLLSKFCESNEDNNIIKSTLLLSLSTSGMLSGVCYNYKLYKACIEKMIEKEIDSIQLTGNIAYFILRPLFSMVFSIVGVIGMLGGMFIVTGNLDYILNEKFMYLSIFLSCMIGFSTGDFMDKFRIFSKKNV